MYTFSSFSGMDSFNGLFRLLHFSEKMEPQPSPWKSVQLENFDPTIELRRRILCRLDLNILTSGFRQKPFFPRIHEKSNSR